MKMFVYLCLLISLSFANSALTLDIALEKVKQKNREIDLSKMDELISGLEEEWFWFLPV